MNPSDFREFLKANGCTHKRTRLDGTEAWIKPGLNVAIVFLSTGELTATELERLIRLMGLDVTALGAWRKGRS